MNKNLLITVMTVLFLCTVSAVKVQNADVNVGGSVAKPYKINAAAIAAMKKLR